MQSVVVEQTHLCWMGICSKETSGCVIHHLPLTDRETMRRWQRSGAKAPLSVTNMGKGAGTTSIEKYKNKRQICCSLMQNLYQTTGDKLELLSLNPLYASVATLHPHSLFRSLDCSKKAQLFILKRFTEKMLHLEIIPAKSISCSPPQIQKYSRGKFPLVSDHLLSVCQGKSLVWASTAQERSRSSSCAVSSWAMNTYCMQTVTDPQKWLAAVSGDLGSAGVCTHSLQRQPGLFSLAG